MMLKIPFTCMTVKLSKMESRTRYDVPGYESGGLPYGYLSTNGAAYLVSNAKGEVLGCVEKWGNGPKPWTASRLNSTVTLDPVTEGYAFSSNLLSGKTRNEALVRLLKSL